MGPMRIVPNAREYPGISLYPEQLRVVKTRITWRIARRSPRFFISSYEDFRGGFLQKLNRERESPTSSRGSRFPMMDGNNCSWLLMMKFFFLFFFPMIERNLRLEDRFCSDPRWIIRIVGRPPYKSHLGHDFTGEINHTAHTSFGGRGGE